MVKGLLFHITTPQHDASCQCQAWRPATVSSDLPTLLDSCKTCNHSLEAHVRPIKDFTDDQIDRTLFVVYDMDNILLQMKNEKDDQDLRKTYAFLFQSLKKHMLQTKLPSLAGEKLGTPPFEKPLIAKVSSEQGQNEGTGIHYTVYMYTHVRTHTHTHTLTMKALERFHSNTPDRIHVRTHMYM